MVEDLFLKAMKIICLTRQGLNLWSRNIKWDLLTAVSMSFSNNLVLKDWNYRTHNTDLLSLDENKFDYKKNNLWKKRFSEILKSEACTKWEKWRELKNYELTNSQYKIPRKSWHNTKAHFSVAGNARTDGFCVWFRRISRSGIESPSKIVLRSQSTSSDSKFSFCAAPRQTLAIWHVEYVWITWKRFWKSIFYVCKNQVTTCSDFSSEAMLRIKEVEMVDSLDVSKSSRSIAGKNFPSFEMLDAKIASVCFE